MGRKLVIHVHFLTRGDPRARIDYVCVVILLRVEDATADCEHKSTLQYGARNISIELPLRWIKGLFMISTQCLLWCEGLLHWMEREGPLMALIRLFGRGLTACSPRVLAV